MYPVDEAEIVTWTSLQGAQRSKTRRLQEGWSDSAVVDDSCGSLEQEQEDTVVCSRMTQAVWLCRALPRLSSSFLIGQGVSSQSIISPCG